MTDIDDKSWIDRARARMKDLGITQAQLGEGIGALPARVGHYMSGRNEPPIAHLMLIARYLHVTTDWLLFGGNAEPIRIPTSEDILAARIRDLDPAARRDVEGYIKAESPHRGLTIRSSRDRFAARLARYRVPPRRAATRPGLTQVLGRKMKLTGGLFSLGLAVLGSYLFLSGLGGLWVDLVPTDPAAIAAARDRGYTLLFAGVIVMLVAATVGGLSARTSPKLVVTSSVILAGASLFPLAFWLFG